ncbi:MAG: phosphoserine aminotransferase / L-aspartate aminotransferase [Solirubrobacterales bacterium]|nr:phosphoserine aminotransferase / L-aspartate aminotransferase [Solirubrobacterales bacterium]
MSTLVASAYSDPTMTADPYIKQYLMTAGPTPLPPQVSQVMAEPIAYHRAPAFVEVHARALARLREVFQTSNEVLSFASSGSGAMESAVANLVVPAEPVTVASAGKFGERWLELARSFGGEVAHLDSEWGEAIQPDALDRTIKEMGRPPRAVFVTQSETSTGVVHDVRALTEVAHRHDAVIVVDAISGLGAVDLPQDEWGVDVVISGSQKSLMCPPGLGFASVGERAMALAAETSDGGRYYFDWSRTAKGQAEDPPNSPFTPAVTLWRALDVALGLILEEGLENVFDRHAVLARAARAGIEAMGLERFGPDDYGANVVTAARMPEGIDGAAVPKLMRDRYGVTAAGGQGRLNGRIVRIAHCGYFGAFDIVIALTALEAALADAGADVEPGAAAGAAQRVFSRAGRAPEPVA